MHHHERRVCSLGGGVGDFLVRFVQRSCVNVYVQLVARYIFTGAVSISLIGSHIACVAVMGIKLFFWRRV